MWSPPEASAPAEAPSGPPGQDLRMVPLTDDDELEPRGPAKSATEFFALPTPKRAAGPTGDEPVTPLRRTDPIALASATPAAPPPAAGPPGGYVPAGAVPSPPVSYGGVPPMAYAPGPQPVALGIQGPIANPGGYPGVQHSAQLPPDLQQEVQRAQSYRVFAIVAGLMFLVFSAVVVTVILTVSVVLYGNQVEDAPQGDPKIVAPQPPPARAIDTGIKAPPLPPPTSPKPASPKPVGTKPTPKPAEPEPPPPALDPAQVTLTLEPGSPPFTSVEIRCPSGFRERGDFVSGVAKVPGVPREGCDAMFKGGPPSKTQVTGGDSKTCTFVGVAANCR